MKIEIPTKLEDKILNDIQKRLHPDYKLIFLKALGVHFLSAIITLSVCPQFGISSFATSINLMDFFMNFGGKAVCDFLCGIFFMGVTLFFLNFILNDDERRTIKAYRVKLISLLTLISIGAFAIMNSNLFLELTFLWVIGSLIGGFISFEIGGKLQHLLMRHHY